MAATRQLPVGSSGSLEPDDLYEQLDGFDHVIDRHGFAYRVNILHAGSQNTGENPFFKKNIGVRPSAGGFANHVAAQVRGRLPGKGHNGVVLGDQGPGKIPFDAEFQSGTILLRSFGTTSVYSPLKGGNDRVGNGL
jgi:hypothetical protein